MDLFRTPFNSALLLLSALVLVGFCLDLCFSHSHSHAHDHHHQNDDAKERTLLPEELAEEDDFKLYGFGYPHDHDHHYYNDDKELSGLALWLNALGCSFLVSMASLICLIIPPVIFVQGKPSKGFTGFIWETNKLCLAGCTFLVCYPRNITKLLWRHPIHVPD